MIRLPSTPHQLLEAVRTRILPWVEGGESVILADVAPRPLGNIGVRSIPGEPLREKRGWGNEVREQFWLNENMNAMSVPYMGCVLEGEADIMVGMTTSMYRKDPRPEKRWVLGLPQGSIFLVPPGVPISAGGKIHWERPEPKKARSLIAWLQFHPAGVCYHACATENQKHWGTSYLVVHNNRLMPLVESVVEELQFKTSQSLPIAYHQLGILFRYIVRDLENRHYSTFDSHPGQLTQTTETLPATPTLQRALQFIDNNLNEPGLDVTTIAQHSQVSTTHLTRIFQQHFGVPVKQFVLNKRHQLACQMLTESSYNIRQISIYCGYGHHCSFIKSFTQREGVSPLRYRQRALQSAIKNV